MSFHRQQKGRQEAYYDFNFFHNMFEKVAQARISKRYLSGPEITAVPID